MWKSLALVALCGRIATVDPKLGSCEAVAKQHAKSIKLTLYKPADCTPKGGAQAPALITKQDDLRQNLACKDNQARSGIDFKKPSLVVIARSASPAQVGTDVYDDGKMVTFVNRERSPTTTLYQVSTGRRTFANGSCTVETTCPK